MLPAFGNAAQMLNAQVSYLDFDGGEANFDTYLQEINNQLDAAESSDFSPDLADTDAMIESLQIQP